MKDIITYIYENKIDNYADFLMICIQHSDDWFDVATNYNTLAINKMIDGLRYEDLYNSNEQLKKYAETNLPKRIKYVTEKSKEKVRDYNDLVASYNKNLDKIVSLEKENKSLKNEIKGIYKGFKAFFKDSKEVTTEQVKTLVGGVVAKVKEYVKGGEFEKIHINETQTRDRNELSR